MARSVMEVPFLGTQRTPVEGKTYYKLFYGDEPDGITDNGLSIISMAIDDVVGDEVFAAGANFEPMEMVRITFEIERGGQNKGKNVALHIEAVEKPASRPTASATPTPAAQPQKPEPTKAQ
jgi:hypothetical protein